MTVPKALQDRPPGSAIAGNRRRPVLVLAVFVALASLTTACGTNATPRFVAVPPGSAAPTGSPSASASASPAPPPSPASSAVVPPGVTAGIAVFDRQTGTFTEQRNITMRFRSASLVKLLIALDYLWNRGPGYVIPAADRARFDLMLRSSDDDAATHFYQLDGARLVVQRMVARLGLKDTMPPPANRTGWGSTALSAADLVRIYRYLLDTAPAPVRDTVMGDLRQSTRCGTDGFDQSFGIPSALGRPYAVKQGWYEFAGTSTHCVEKAAATSDAVFAPVVGAAAPAANDPDFVGEVLHTTGVVGAADRAIVVVLTVQRHGTPFATASANLTKLTASLRIPGRG